VYKTACKITLVLLTLFTLGLNAEERVEKYQLAEKISTEAIELWNISIFPDGKNLPEGKGDYKTGKVIYDNQCMACHGENGKGGIKLDPYRNPIETLVKSKNDSLIGEKPKKNIGTFWQYAPSLFDYMRRTMPYQSPKSLSADELYALTAYLLAENGIISKELVVNKDNLAKIKMPNVKWLVIYIGDKSVKFN
jgi:cytochrome c